MPATQAGTSPAPVLQFEGGLVPALLLKRYKRFLGDVQLSSEEGEAAVAAAASAAATTAAAALPAADGAEPAEQPTAAAATVVHVPNTGPMTGLLDNLPAEVVLSRAAAGSKRKYLHTLEWIRPEPGVRCLPLLFTTV